MPIDALESFRIDSAIAAQAEREAAEDEIGQSNFLEMLVAQLENQDPLNPQDSADFAAQLAQFSTVEQLIAVREGVDELVSQAELGGDPSAPFGGATSLDPASLVGKDVVVYGSQIEVDAARSEVTMAYRTVDAALDANVVIRDVNGETVQTVPLNPADPDTGERASIRPGDHVWRFDPSDYDLDEGVYAVEFVGTGPTGEPVTFLPMVEGLVTGAILAGEPGIRVGGQIFPVADVLEVKIAGSAQ